MNLFEPGPDPLLPVDPDGEVDPLTVLAVLDPADLRFRPLDEVAGRATRLRTVRRSRTAVLGAAASVALVVAVTTMLPSGGTVTSPADGPTQVGTPLPTPTRSASATPVLTPPAGAGDLCQFAAAAPAGVPQLVRLLPDTADLRLTTVMAERLPEPSCSERDVPTPVARVRRSADGGTADLALSLTGPSATPLVEDPEHPGPSSTQQPPATPGEVRDPGLVRTTPALHGGRGLLLRYGRGAPRNVVGTASLQWQEPSTGQWWLLRTSGLAADEVVALAEGLDTAADRVDLTNLPTSGWTDVTPGRPATGDAQFQAVYEAGSSNVLLRVVDVAREWFDPATVAPGTIRFADVRGSLATFAPAGFDTPVLSWSADGADLVLYGAAGQTEDDLLQMARAVVPVPPDDPRVTAHTDTPRPTLTPQDGTSPAEPPGPTPTTSTG